MIALDADNPNESHIVERSENGEQVRQKITDDVSPQKSTPTGQSMKNFNKRLKKNLNNDPSTMGLANEKIPSPSLDRNPQSQ